jgi:hypothetical protein
VTRPTRPTLPQDGPEPKPEAVAFSVVELFLRFEDVVLLPVGPLQRGVGVGGDDVVFGLADGFAADAEPIGHPTQRPRLPRPAPTFVNIVDESLSIDRCRRLRKIRHHLRSLVLRQVFAPQVLFEFDLAPRRRAQQADFGRFDLRPDGAR